MPGESDGECLRGPAGPADPERSVKAPPAGQWFPAQARELIELAEPPLPAVMALGVTPLAMLASAPIIKIAAAQQAPIADAAASAEANPDNWPARAATLALDPAIEGRIDDLVAAMSLEQKVSQIIQADIGSVTPEDVYRYHLGSVLNGVNSDPSAG